MKNQTNLRPQTRAIHAGEPPRHGVDVPVNSGIVRSSTFTFASSREIQRWAEGKSKAYIYSRYGNPTLTVVEKKIAALEGAEAAIVTSAGMAAISHSLLSLLSSGDELISTAEVYGGTYRLMRDVLPRLGIVVRHVDSSLAGLEDAVSAKTRCLYVESPTNPTLHLVDLRKAAGFAKKHKLVSIADNTFATPMLQNPVAFGFDMVVHSVTKGLAGH
jgi:methionine-gamma-lyase